MFVSDTASNVHNNFISVIQKMSSSMKSFGLLLPTLHKINASSFDSFLQNLNIPASKKTEILDSLLDFLINFNYLFDQILKEQ